MRRRPPPETTGPTPTADRPGTISGMDPSEPTSLADVRARIDGIDTDLVRLLAERESLVRAAAAFKTDANAVRAPDRVEQVIRSVRERAAAAGLSPAVAEAVWRAMIAAFVDLELDQHARTGPTGPDR
jgi:isochorismate pyruvate lyase